MLHFKMCNISNFAQISSVLAQRSIAPTRLLLSSRPGKGPAVWFLSKLLYHKWTLQQDGRRASGHGP